MLQRWTGAFFQCSSFLCFQEFFFSSLSQENISEEDYKHAQQVWDTFSCTSLGDYHDLYLQTDVMLLVDVFEKFRKTAMTTYALDPAHYHTLPGYSWDCLLKSTNVSLELLTEPDMYLFVEKGLRGGISMVSHRHDAANNQYMQNYDPEQPTSYLLYLDANSLYAWAMSQPMPTGNFQWVSLWHCYCVRRNECVHDFTMISYSE